MRSGIFAHRFIGLVIGVALFAGIGMMAHANDDRIPVGTVNGETLWLAHVGSESASSSGERAPVGSKHAFSV